MKTSKAMVLESPGKMVLREFPIPEIGPEEGLLKVEMVGICGSDVGTYRGKVTRAPRPYPIIMGHEIFGTIAEIGEEMSKKKGILQGERVVVEYTFGWVKRWRRLVRNYEQRLDVPHVMITSLTS